MGWRHETTVIVGAGLAGGRAAQTLRARGFDGRVVLVGEEPDGPYERPQLSKEMLAGRKTADQTLLSPAAQWRDVGVELVTGTRAVRIVPHERAVLLAGGRRLVADRLLLATGVRARRLGVPGADLEGVHSLRTVADAVAIRAYLEAAAPIVVVGAGFIGSEVAASAREAGCSVTVLELQAAPLRAVLGMRLGTSYAGYHRRRGVDVRTGVGVARIEGDGRVRTVVTTDGTRIDAACVVVGIGVDPVDELAAEAGIATADGIVVDAFCRTSRPGVYAAGDVARAPNPYHGAPARVEHWQNAQNQGVAAAGSMLGDRTEFAEVPWFWSDFYDLNLQVAGVPGRADRMVLRGDPDDERFCAFYLRDGALIGAVAVNRPRDLRAAMSLIRSGAPVDPRQLSDDDVDLRGLARVRR